MGSFFGIPGHDHRSAETDTMITRTTNECLGQSQKEPSGSVKPTKKQKQTMEREASTNMSNNRTQPSDRAGYGKSNQKHIYKNTTSLDSASDILDDMKQCCSNLSSIEERMEDTAFSSTQQREINDMQKHAYGILERISETMRIKDNSATTDSASSICLTDSGNPETPTEITECCPRHDTKSSLPVVRNKKTLSVGEKKVEELYESSKIVTALDSKEHNNYFAIANRSSSIQSEKSLEYDRINQYLKNLNLEEIEDETAVIEILKNYRKREDMPNNTEHSEKFGDKGNGDNFKLKQSNYEKSSLANEEVKLEEKDKPPKLVKHIPNEHISYDGNACRDEMMKINSDTNSTIANEKTGIKNIVQSERRLDDSDSYMCETFSKLKLEEKKRSDDERSMNKNKLKEIEKRRNELKPEIECFVGTNSDPKFHELKEYSVRLLLEMDDLIVPKGSDLHKRKRELLKEVYQYSDILEKKANDFEFLTKVENSINYITNHFIKISKTELKKVAKYIKYAKSELYQRDYGILLEERKQMCIDQLDALEKKVNYIMHQKSTNLPLARKPKEIVEDDTHSTEEKGNLGDTSIKPNSLTPTNGSNRNETVIIDPKKCNKNEQFLCTENASNEARVVTETNQFQKIRTRQEQQEIIDTAGDENIVDLSSQLQSIEGQSDDSHSGGILVKYITNTVTKTALDYIERIHHETIQKIISIDDFGTWQECQMLKDDLLQEHSRLNGFKIESEEISRRSHQLNKEIKHWLDYLETLINQRLIRYVEVELQKISEIIDTITEADFHTFRDHLIQLRNILEGIRSKGGEGRNERMEELYKYIQVCLHKIDEKMKTLNFGTTV